MSGLTEFRTDDTPHPSYTGSWCFNPKPKITAVPKTNDTYMQVIERRNYIPGLEDKSKKIKGCTYLGYYRSTQSTHSFTYGGSTADEVSESGDHENTVTTIKFPGGKNLIITVNNKGLYINGKFKKSEFGNYRVLAKPSYKSVKLIKIESQLS